MEKYLSPEIDFYSVLSTDAISVSITYDDNETEEDCVDSLFTTV